MQYGRRCAVRISHPISMEEVCSMNLSHWQCRGGCAVWISHIISRNKGVQYRTIKTAEGVGSGFAMWKNDLLYTIPI